VLHDFYDTGGAWNPLKLDRYDYLWNIAKNYEDTPLYDLTGASLEVNAAISPTIQLHVGQPKWQRVYDDKTVTIYQNKNTLPRAFLVHESFIESKPESIIIAIRRFDHDPRHTVVLEEGSPATSSAKGTAEDPNSGESVRATRYSPNAVDLSIKANSPGWVVLTDAWYPGWEVTVDGKPAALLPADYAYRAVHVDAGQHTVSMQFRPASWRIGRAVSLAAAGLSLAALGLLAFWPLIASGRRRRESAAAE
jgi:hypothetical protein